MSEKGSEAANYRRQRNALLKQAAVQKEVLKSLGVNGEMLKGLESVFCDLEPAVVDGTLVNWNPTSAQITSVRQMLTKGLSGSQSQSQAQSGNQVPAAPVPAIATATAPATTTSTQQGAKPTTPAPDMNAMMQMVMMGMMGKMLGVDVKEFTKNQAPSVPGGLNAAGSGAVPGITREGVAQMTPEQINENWGAISQALTGGQLNA